ncbi:MAG TPA: hypothetical protein VFR91_04180 [Dyella sp.]|nr:hypothetical protein [Dyella sp.]
MTSTTVHPSTQPDAPAPTALQEAIDRALPQVETLHAVHRDYDGRGLLIEPLDHLDGKDGCQRFTIR